MKKLVMLLVVALAAVVAQASSVKWSASNIFNGNTTDKISGGAAYLFAVGGDVTSAGVSSFLSGTDSIDAKNTFLSSKSVTSTKTSSTGVINTTLDVSLADGTYDFFMVVFDSDPVTDASKFFTSATVSGVAVTSVGTASIGFASQKALTQDASNFASVSGGGGDVPEPTSGLLLLIGGAMMALRRKQK